MRIKETGGVTFINPKTGVPLNCQGDTLWDEKDNIIEKKAGVYRFVGDDNYTSSFGLQWNQFEKTQIDREARRDQSQVRFFAETGWNDLDLAGENILEVGSGAGRFTEVVLKYTKANLYSVDFSDAVEANYRNNGPNDRLQLFQANVYELPFQIESFDRAFCFGVLQHTPDFKKSVKCLAEMVKPGGELIVDFYSIRGWYTKWHVKYFLRPWTKQMGPQKLLTLIDRNIDWLIRAYNLMHRVGLGIFTRFLPVCDIKNTTPVDLEPQRFREWVILDTFDMFSPQYDNPQKISTVRSWFETFGIGVTFAGTIAYGGKNQTAVVKGIKE